MISLAFAVTLALFAQASVVETTYRDVQCHNKGFVDPQFCVRSHGFLRNGFSSSSQCPNEKEGGIASDMHAVPHLFDRSVLDGIVDILRGAQVQKRQGPRSFSEHWMWIDPDLVTLHWKSQGRDAHQGHLNLTEVKKLHVVEREVIVETSYMPKLSFLLNTEQNAAIWVKGLSSLVPENEKGPRANSALVQNFDNLARINEYILLREIVHDRDCVIHLALSTADNRIYIVKVVQKKKRGSPTHDVAEEQAILRKLEHPNIAKHHDILVDADNQRAVVVMEFLAQGNVMDFKVVLGATPLPEKKARQIMRDVVAGVEYLHFQRIAHLDIKPNNILRAGAGTVKIADCDTARMYDVPSRTGHKVGGLGFVAPEHCRYSKLGPKPLTEAYAADIWAMGVSLYYMVYGRLPFIAQRLPDMHDLICTQQLRFPDEPKISQSLTDLLEKMLTKEPRKRATVKEVAQHAWFEAQVMQPVELKRIQISALDVENAIGDAVWSSLDDRAMYT